MKKAECSFLCRILQRAQTCWLIKKNELIQEVKQETLESSTNTIQSLNKFRFTPIYGKYGWDSVEKLQLDYERLKKEQREKSLRERVNRLDELLPYSLSRAFSVASNAKTPNDQHKMVIRLFDLLNKYHVFLA